MIWIEDELRFNLAFGKAGDWQRFEFFELNGGKIRVEQGR